MAKKVKQVFWNKVKKVKVTLLLALVLALAYFSLSQGNLFIEKMLLESLSFSTARPFNIVLYMFTHMSVWHLAVNVLSLLFFAAVFELALSGRDVAGCFFFSGILTVGFFSAFNPGVSLVGASAGVWGVMAGSFVLDAKKAIAGFAVIVLLLLLVFPAAEFVVRAEEQALESRQKELETKFNSAVAEGKTEEAEKIYVERIKVGEKASGFIRSREFAAKAKIDPFLHSYAAFFGIAYLMLFKRRETMKAIKKQKVLGFLKRGKKQKAGKKA